MNCEPTWEDEYEDRPVSERPDAQTHVVTGAFRPLTGRCPYCYEPLRPRLRDVNEHLRDKHPAAARAAGVGKP